MKFWKSRGMPLRPKSGPPSGDWLANTTRMSANLPKPTRSSLKSQRPIGSFRTTKFAANTIVARMIRPVRTEPPQESARRKAARVRAYKAKINSVINDMLEAERREARYRSEAVMITVTLFLSTLFVAAARPSASIGPYDVFTQVILWGLCLLGVWQFVRSLHLVLNHFTYRPRVLSVTDEDSLPAQPFSRATAWGFLILGYAVSLTLGGFIGQLVFSDPQETFTALDFVHDACVYPPIAILAVINLRRLEEFLHRI